MLLSANKKFIVLCVFFLLIVVLYIFTPIHDTFSRENLENTQQWIQGKKTLAPLLFIGLYIVTAVLLIPVSILTILGGLLFGVWQGLFLVIFASNTAAFLAFCIARFLGRETIQKLLKTKFSRLKEKIRTQGFYVVLWLRLIPLMPYSILNYVLGITEIKLKDYVLASFLGMFPASFAYVSLGNAANYISFRDPHVWTKIEVWGPLILIISIAFLPKFFKKKGGQLEEISKNT